MSVRITRSVLNFRIRDERAPTSTKTLKRCRLNLGNAKRRLMSRKYLEISNSVHDLDTDEGRQPDVTIVVLCGVSAIRSAMNGWRYFVLREFHSRRARPMGQGAPNNFCEVIEASRE